MAEREERTVRRDSFGRMKAVFISSLAITAIYTMVALVIALNTGSEQLDRAVSAESDRDVRQMYGTIRPILSALICVVIAIEWIILSVGIVGALREHYTMSCGFAIAQGIGLICSLFQIGPVLFQLKLVWLPIITANTALAIAFVFCLRGRAQTHTQTQRQTLRLTPNQTNSQK